VAFDSFEFDFDVFMVGYLADVICCEFVPDGVCFHGKAVLVADNQFAVFVFPGCVTEVGGGVVSVPDGSIWEEV